MEHRPRLNDEEFNLILEFRKTGKIPKIKSVEDSGEPEKFVLSAWNKNTGLMMDIDSYCSHYNLPKQDIKEYKLVSHTGTPFYNVLFKENIYVDGDIDFDSIISKHISAVEITRQPICLVNDFDTLTYCDVHIGMDTDGNGNSMYPVLWNRESILKSAKDMALKTIDKRKSPILYVDELGDFLDGYNALTTRGGHPLPQNMTNEEAFDCALEFKMTLLDMLVPYYEKLVFNNICNDNHAGSFGYFVNKAFKDIANVKYDSVEVNNYRMFISHYFVGDIAFIISHGKDDSTLKFGFKPQLESKGSEKIDQYCKQNDIYKKAKLIIFKKADSHQALFDMCTSDDFYYFNYPALSPSSQWVQNNFKKGRRGFVLESYNGINLELNPIFNT